MRERNPQKIEVHVAGICFKEDKILILKRDKNRELYPGLWECGGGQVNSGENFKEAIKRQFKEEAGIIVKPAQVLNVYDIEIDEKQKKIPGVKFICQFVDFDNESVSLGKEHTEYKWISIKELGDFDFIPGIEEDIKQAYTKANP